jgi:peptidoglycan/xylan/chitin deacetylase (PgdA/CDA1 family)
MQKYGFKGVNSIITGLVGQVWHDDDPWRQKPLMTQDQIQTLHNAGWNIVSHSVDHRHWNNTAYPEITEPEATWELTTSKQWLVNNSYEPYVFAYPWGEVTYEDIAFQNYYYIRTIENAPWDGKTKEIPIATSLNQAIQWAQNGNIACLLLHGIRQPGQEKDPWEILVDDFDNMLNTINSTGIPVKTFTETISVNHSLPLNTGWNMVSFPVIPNNASFPSIFSGAGYYQVVTWSGTSYIDARPGNATLGIGYWILVLSDTLLNITGVPVESYERDLPAGWSMIGSAYDKTVNAANVFGNTYYQLVTWSGTSYVNATAIEPGKGYWALVLESTHITVDARALIVR